MIIEKQEGNKLIGFYRAEVLKHCNNGMVKLYIPGVTDEQYKDKPDMLPFAEQASPLLFGTNSGLGVFSYPNIGSIVWCFFANGDQNQPVYFAATLGGQQAIENWNKALCMVGSHPDDAYTHYINIKNAEIKIQEPGSIEINTKNSGAKTHLKLDAQGNIYIDCTNQVTIKAKNILLDAETQLNLKAESIDISGEKGVAVNGEAISLNANSGLVKINSENWKFIY